MINFDEKYYSDIWNQGVHRKDYVPWLVNHIQEKIGYKCRILDVGCGAGYLVDGLNKAGFEAFGVDVSEYAILESPFKDKCFLASANKLPFPSNSFDFIFSNGLFEYIKESDISTVLTEFSRVAKCQFHRIDHDNDPFRGGFETVKSIEWWRDKFKESNIKNLDWENIFETDKVLIATPTFEGKEYCFEEYLNSIQKLDWPNKEYLIIDNSDTLDFYNRWKDKINPNVKFIHLDLVGLHGNRKIASSMEHIREYFLKSDAKWYLNLESDVILPSDSLKKIIEYSKDFDWDWVSHNYPSRQDNREIMEGFGCTMFSKNIMRESFLGAPRDDIATDGWFWNKKIKINPNYKTIEAWNLIDIKHRN